MVKPTLQIRALSIIGLVLAAMGVMSCRHTQVTSTTKDPGYSATAMQRVLVIAAVRKTKTQHSLEDAFVQNLKDRKREAVASYTLVPEGAKLELEAWKRLVNDNRFDSVIISRLVDLEVIDKEVDPKYITGPSGMGNGYGYYNSSYSIAYQPGFSMRTETAVVETRVYDAAADKQVWSAHSKTSIEEGRDPDAQIRDFVDHMMKEIF